MRKRIRKQAKKIFKKLKEQKEVVSEHVKRYRVAPLPGTFMLTGMIGFIVCGIYTLSGRLNMTWGISFSLVFALMFFASVLSMTPRRI